jgi:Pyridine nucleotide-disulphide oxidoreductase
MAVTTDIAVIGAGPYGLSIGAHLHARGADLRVIGEPMELWRTQTPKGMRLKSEAFASDLFDPRGEFRLRDYYAERGMPYEDFGPPVHVETFSQYGLEFQRRFVPTLERKKLARLDQAPDGFALTLDDGEEFTARRVVMATGLNYFRFIPSALAHLPPELVTHSGEHQVVDHFRGREVAVIGAGASGINLAVLFHEAGVPVHLVARRPTVEIHTQMRLPRPLSDRLRAPMSKLGPSWRSFFYSELPHLFYHLPEEKRLRVVRNHLGPAGGWYMRDRAIGKFPLVVGYRPTAASVLPNGRIDLRLTALDGTERRLEVDHVACGTGFQVNLRRMTCLSETLQAQIRTVENAPVLTSRFECSVPGLHFVGPIAANSFGPVLRFAYGAKFTARRLARHLLRQAVRRPIHGPSPLPLSPRPLAEGTGGD